MRKAKLFLFASVVANVCMMILIIGPPRHFLNIRLTNPAAKDISHTAISLSGLITNRTIMANPQRWWANVEAHDYPTYIKRLRSVGCPELTIRDIIYSEINRLYAPAIAPLNHSRSQLYWLPAYESTEPIGNVQKLRVLMDQKREIIRILLGEEAEYDYALLYDDMSRDFDYLADNKRAAVADIHLTYLKQQTDLYSKADGRWDVALWHKIRDMRRQWRNDLKAVLNDSEIREYELRNSWTAKQLRSDLAYMPNTTEAEFSQMFDQRSKLENEYPITGVAGLSNEENARFVEQRAQMQDGVRSILGDERYNEYVRSQDPVYVDMRRLAERTGVAPEQAAQFYNFKEWAETERARIIFDNNINLEQRTAQLQRVSTSVQEAGITAFGEESFKNYQAAHGRWVSRMAKVTNE